MGDMIVSMAAMVLVIIGAFAVYYLVVRFFTAYEMSGTREDIDENRGIYYSRRSRLTKDKNDARKEDEQIEHSTWD